MRVLFACVAIAASLFISAAHAEEENLEYLRGVDSILVDETLGNTCAIMNLSADLQPSAIFPVVRKIMEQTPAVSLAGLKQGAVPPDAALVLHFTFSSYTETVGGESKGAGALTMQMTRASSPAGLPLASSMPFVLPETCDGMQERLSEAALQLVQYLPGYFEAARANK